MKPEVELLLKAVELFERYDKDTQATAGAHIARLYAGGYFSSVEAEIEARRANDRERQQRHRSRDESRDVSQNGGVLSTLKAASAVGSKFLEAPKSSSKTPRTLSQEDLDKAKGLLLSADFEFLQACPEPFRTEWLSVPDWLISLRDGYPKLDLLVQASKNMAHVQGKFTPAQIARLNLRERLRRCVAKADMWRQNGEERKAVRR